MSNARCCAVGSEASRDTGLPAEHTQSFGAWTTRAAICFESCHSYLCLSRQTAMQRTGTYLYFLRWPKRHFFPNPWGLPMAVAAPGAASLQWGKQVWEARLPAAQHCLLWLTAVLPAPHVTQCCTQTPKPACSSWSSLSAPPYDFICWVLF